MRFGASSRAFSLVAVLCLTASTANADPISTIHSNDANGNVIGIGTPLTVTGVITSPDSIFSKTSTEVYIQDATGGTELFQSGGISTWRFSYGDSVTVTGTIAQFRGMSELSPLSSVVKHKSGAVVPDPVLKTCDQVTTQTWIGGSFTEPDEGRLIRIDNVRLTAGTWPATISGTDAILTISDASPNSCTLFLDKDSPLNGSPAPGDTFSVIGILKQFDTAVPYNFGYEIEPRFLSDVIRRGPAFLSGPTVTALDSTFATITWTTDKNATGVVDWGTSTAYGSSTSQAGGNSTSHSVTLMGLTPGTLYHFRAVSADSLGGLSQSGDRTFITPINRPAIINVYFNKSTDAAYSTGQIANGSADLGALLISRINAATYSIDAAVYSFSYAPVTDALIAAKNRGVKVRFIMDAGNSPSEMNRLSSAGIPTITSTYGGNHASGGIHHNKIFIVDARDGVNTNDWTWTGSANITTQGLYTDAQNSIEIKDPSLAACFTAEFNEEWGSDTDTPNSATSKMGNRKSDNTPHSLVVGGIPIEVYFSPSDGTESQIVSDINTLTSTAFFSMMVMTQDAFENAMWLKWTGVPGFLVKGVWDSGNINASGSEWWDFIGQPGGDNPWNPVADVFVDGLSSGILHHKYFIGDENIPSNSFVVTGSHNWSASANQDNDENTLIIHDATIANLYMQEFAARYHEAGGTQFLPLPVTAVGDGADRTGRIALSAPRPNPARGSVALAYTLPSASRVTVAVYDIAGRVVDTLVDGETVDAGAHAVRWNGSSSAAGVYVVKLTADGVTASQRIVFAP